MVWFGGMPRVSVVLPVFNAVATVVRAIESIRAQTWGDWELVVVDDGSTDGTREMVRTLAREEARMRVIEWEHAGVVAAANAGIAAARGDLIARMDADDESHPERLAEQVALLEREVAVGVAGCLVEFGGDRVARAGYALHVDWLNALVTPEEIARARFMEQPVANPSVLWRRELAERHGVFRDGDFPEDYELWLRWLDAGVRIAKVPRVLLTWQDAPTRISRTDARYAPEAFFRTKAEWIARELARSGNGRAVWVWGAGRHTRKRAAYLETWGVRIAGYVDVDVKKTGRGIGGTGAPVIGVEALPAPGEIVVLSYVTTRGAREYNRARLVERGYAEGRDFWLCG
jgi:glycosyltransferase involved in cell wall biosynthesis